jgi:hypothetical protein
VCACVCARLCARVCVCACVRVRVCAYVQIQMDGWMDGWMDISTKCLQGHRMRVSVWQPCACDSIRFAVPSTPPPSRLKPKTQRLDPIRAPAVLGGTAPCAQLSGTCTPLALCVCAACLRVDAALWWFLCALCDGARAGRRACVRLRARVCVCVCMNA